MPVMIPVIVKMKVPPAVVRMRVYVDSGAFSQHEIQQPCSESNDHHRDAKFQRIGNRVGDGDAKDNDQQSRE